MEYQKSKSQKNQNQNWTLIGPNIFVLFFDQSGSKFDFGVLEFLVFIGSLRPVRS